MELLREFRNHYSYEQELTEQQYESVLQMALKTDCDYFEFTIRHDIDFKEDYSYSYNSQPYQLLDELSEFLVKVEKTNRWGTSIVIRYEIVADVYRFKLNSASLGLLLKYSSKISDWCGPTLPEDIAFFRGKNMWMGTAGHETMIFWHLTDAEYEEITSFGIDLWKG